MKTMRVLMVCMGNICRSPMMEGWLRDAVAKDARLKGRVDVDSAGIGAWHVGHPPDARAIAEARRHGVDISGQRARQLVARDFNDFDLLLFADEDTLRDGRARASEGDADKAARFLQWAGIEGDHDLADPYYGDAADFSAAWTRIEQAGPKLLARLHDELARDDRASA